MSKIVNVNNNNLNKSHLHFQVSLDVNPDVNEVTINVKTNPGSIVSIFATDQKSFSDNLRSTFFNTELHRFNKRQKSSLNSDLFMFSFGNDFCSLSPFNENLNQDRRHDEKHSSESWIFETQRVHEDGSLTLTRTVPNSVGPWFITVVSVHQDLGLTIFETKKLLVQKNFFVKMNIQQPLRYSETTKVNVLVFNFLPEAKEVKVTLSKSESSGDFKFLQRNSDCIFSQTDEDDQINSVHVEPHSVGYVKFYVHPKTTESVSLKVQAQLDDDSVESEETFDVEDEGITKHDASSVLIDLRKIGNFPPHSMSFEIPSDAIQNSIKIEASVERNVIKQALPDPKKLMYLSHNLLASRKFHFHLNCDLNFYSFMTLSRQNPSGSSEKFKVLKFLTSMSSLSNLPQIGQLKNEDIPVVNDYIKTAYEQILMRRNSDGSFGFKGRGKVESIWLTSHVVQCIGQIKSLNANVNVVTDALKFLKKQQKLPNDKDAKNVSLTGGFVEFGAEPCVDIVLTSFVLISFLENPKFSGTHKDVIDKALKFIGENIAKINNFHEVSIAAYALVLAKHEEAKNLVNYLDSQVVVEGDKAFWNYEAGKSSNDSIKLEIAAYALLAYLRMGRETESLPVMLWIVSQLNLVQQKTESHAFAVAYQALAEFSKIHSEVQNEIDLTLHFNDQKKSFHIGKIESTFENIFQLPSNVRDVTIFANGTGFVSLEFLIKYDRKFSEFKDSFIISTAVNPSDDDNLHLTVCASLKIDEDEVDSESADEVKSMNAILQIELPPG